jgi:hypothetical protein
MGALPTNLTTNEVKNSAGTEVEFLRKSTGPGNTVVFAVSGEANLKHRITVSSTESGTGIGRRRRSLIRVDKESISGVDAVTVAPDSAYMVVDRAVGAHTDDTHVENVTAELMSFCASLGASTTILYDCSGYGARAAIDGSI